MTRNLLAIAALSAASLLGARDERCARIWHD